MKSGKPFPENAHTVFETYISNRLTRDEERLQRRFKLNASEIRSAAESIAFCMVSDKGLGLSPIRDRLKEALGHQGLQILHDVDIVLDALEYIKLARPEVALYTGEKSFTFSHRRFQEYFATSVVLREPTRVAPEHLLTDARWRETAVVICQIQPKFALKPIIEKATQLLIDFCSDQSDLIDSTLDFVLTESPNVNRNQLMRVPKNSHWFSEIFPLPNLSISGFRERLQRLPRNFNMIVKRFVNSLTDRKLPKENFPWPAGLYHLLGLLQDGFRSRLVDLPDDIRNLVGQLLLSATEERSLDDRKDALEVAGIVPEPILIYLLKQAFSSESQWLKEVAYRQVAYVSSINSDIKVGIYKAIVELASSGRLHKEYHATKAHLSRLPQSASLNFLSAMNLLYWLSIIDLVWQIVILILIIIYIKISNPALYRLDILWIPLILLCISYWGSWELINRRFQRSDLSVKLVFISFLRLIIACLLLILLPISFSGPVNLNSVMFIGFGLLLWAIILSQSLLPTFAFSAAQRGFLTFVLPWAFLPFWPFIWSLVFFFSRVPSTMATLLKVRNYFKWLAIIVIWCFFIALIFLLIALVIFLIIFFVFLLVPPSFFTSIGNSIQNNPKTPEIFLIASSAALLLAITGFLSQVRRDIKRLKKSFSEYKHPIDCKYLFQEMNSYSTLYNFCYSRTLKTVRERNMLVLSKETEECIRQVAIRIEAERQFQRDRSGTALIYTLLSEYRVLRSNDDYKRFVKNADSKTLDELFNLLKFVRNARLDSSKAL